MLINLSKYYNLSTVKRLASAIGIHATVTDEPIEGWGTNDKALWATEVRRSEKATINS